MCVCLFSQFFWQPKCEMPRTVMSEADRFPLYTNTYFDFHRNADDRCSVGGDTVSISAMRGISLAYGKQDVNSHVTVSYALMVELCVVTAIMAVGSHALDRSTS